MADAEHLAAALGASMARPATGSEVQITAGGRSIRFLLGAYA
jgi:hypothetical protein